MDHTTEVEQDYIEVFGAREHNLKNIDIKIPRNKLVVFTGISGSGKSSLAFDTIYAEGQRRYMESFSAYARSFIGDMERPDVDKINGLSPVISIEQKTTSKNPRSSVGTTTEIYDFLRLLFARAGEAFSYVNGNRMAKMSEDQILDTLLEKYIDQKLILLAPVVKGRKGHYRELFQSIRKLGFTKVRVDGEIIEIGPKTETDRYKIHDIEIVIDRIVATNEDRFRISQSVKLAMTHGKGVILLLDEKGKAHFFSKHLMDAESGIAYDDPAPNLFSPNSPYGWCPSCHGLGIIEEITESNILPDKSLSISRGAIAPLGEYRDIWIFGEINKILKKHKLSITTPIQDLSEIAFQQVMYGDGQPYIYGSIRNPDSFEGIVNYLKRQLDEGSEKTKEWVEEYVTESVCHTCKGEKLRIEALHFKIAGKNIAQISCLQLDQLSIWIDQLFEKLDKRQKQIAEEVIKEIGKRLGFLLDVGLEYLTLDRKLKTLSGGEAQRIRLATQIGSQLVGVLYILDEPSIGLHQRDNEKLIKSLINLRDIGNTVLVVEHDKDMMLASDFVVDIGPGAGIHGGKVVNANIPSEFIKQDTTTSKYLSGALKIERDIQKELKIEKKLILRGAKGNNLKNLTLELPLGNLICITGVSGSGKSTLIHDTLYPILNKYFFNAKRDPLTYDSIEGLEHIDKVIEVDQAPIGRTPRSNPATYTGVFTEIRNLFSQMNEAKIRGYSSGRFSFNVKGGRCEVCEGAGMRVIEMEFLPDVHVPCDQCKGKRYNRETLEIRFKGKSISDVLDMTVAQAEGFFENQPRIYRYVKTLNEVGLGYITLGQHATTLSGGEAQRVKLASELSKKDTGKTLYILDEPTTGLHFQDIKHLLDVLSKLVERGNTVLVIEHNMDIIKCADWIIDIGPDSGKAGGEIVVEGSPKKVSEAKSSHTGRFLKLEM